MLRIVYAMLRTGELYRDPEADYEAPVFRSAAPHWIRMMKKHGYELESLADRRAAAAA